MRFRPTRCRRHFIQSVSPIQGPAAETKISGTPIFDFVPLTQMGPEPFFNMILDGLERPAAITIVKVANPAPHGGVDFYHYSFKRFYRSRSPREHGHSIFDNLLEQ